MCGVPRDGVAASGFVLELAFGTGVMRRPTAVHTAEPERRLMAAVLWRAVDDSQGSGFPMATESRKILKARAYVASRDRTWPFSFENLCESLDVSARHLRRALQRIRVSGHSANAPLN